MSLTAFLDGCPSRVRMLPPIDIFAFLRVLDIFVVDQNIVEGLELIVYWCIIVHAAFSVPSACLW